MLKFLIVIKFSTESIIHVTKSLFYLFNKLFLIFYQSCCVGKMYTGKCFNCMPSKICYEVIIYYFMFYTILYCIVNLRWIL